jgi:hypothetical protein
MVYFCYFGSILFSKGLAMNNKCNRKQARNKLTYNKAMTNPFIVLKLINFNLIK